MTNKKVNWKLALLTLGVGVLLGGWSLYKTQPGTHRCVP